MLSRKCELVLVSVASPGITPGGITLDSIISEGVVPVPSGIPHGYVRGEHLLLEWSIVARCLISQLLVARSSCKSNASLLYE